MSRSTELQGVNLLDVAPARTAEWEEVDDRVVLLRPPPSGRGFRLLVEWVTSQMAARRVRLDEIGSFAWKHLDGGVTVGEVARLLEAEFGQRVTPATERLGRLVRMLHREGFLIYPGIDPVETAQPGG